MFLESNAGADRPLIRDLVAEANHRIANSLSAVAALVQQRISGLSEDQRPMQPSEVRQMLAEVRARVDAVARLHRALSDLSAGDPIDVGKYLQQIASELVATLSAPGTVTLHFACELGCRISASRALYLGLAVVELVTNAIKYAHPTGVAGTIEINCWRTPDAVIVEIEDDGVGLPDGFDPEAATSGLRIVQSLCHQIGGKVGFRNTDLGLACTIQAPFLVSV